MKLLIISFFSIQLFSATQLEYRGKMLSYNNKTFTMRVYKDGKATKEKRKFDLKHLSKKQMKNRHKLVGKVINLVILSP